jgi:hypothetical protein
LRAVAQTTFSDVERWRHSFCSAESSIENNIWIHVLVRIFDVLLFNEPNYLPYFKFDVYSWQ